MPPFLHIIPSGGLFTHQFLEALQQPSFNHPALAPETFSLPDRRALSPAELDRAVGTAWELLVERWDSLERELPRMDLSALRSRWILPLFNLLDLELEYQRADLVLEGDERGDNGLRFPISHLARPVGVAGAEAFLPVHTVLPVGEGLDARRTAPTPAGGAGAGGGLKRLSPHDLLQRYLNLSRDATWGLLCDGLRLRLLRDYHHTYTRGFVEFDLQGIFSARDVSAFRALYRLCHASRFQSIQSLAPAPPAAASTRRRKAQAEEEEESAEAEVEESAAQPLTPLDLFYQHALSTGVKVGEDLRKNVRSAIETLANGFIQSTPGFLNPLRQADATRTLYDEILHIIYRVLFLLFSEQRGMLPGRGSLYMDEFSLTALRARAERPIGADPHVDLWERLKTTFRMVETGVPELGVFGYDGALLSAARTPLLTPSPVGEGAGGEVDFPLIDNASLLTAIQRLTTIQREGVLQRISYADLSVEEMGSVYESLLDYTPRIADHAEILEEEGEPRREIQAGRFFLDPRGKERKTTGSYYTHPSLVNELIRTALVPVLEERLRAAAPGYDAEAPERLSPAQRVAAAQALLDLKVVDPACGSGAFLIAADNLLGLRLAQIRSGDLYPSETAVRQARREALAHGIYGVDLNPMAVELCKVSLWINAAVPDQKLNFLDHHIKCGNSLVGIGPNLPVRMKNEVLLDLSELEIPDEAYTPLSMDEAAIARAAKNRNTREKEQRHYNTRQPVLWGVSAVYVPAVQNLAEINDLSLSDPAEAERRYLNWADEELHKMSCFAADVWTAAFFWPWTKETANRCEPPTEAVFRLACQEGSRVLEPEFIEEVQRLHEEHQFFHWPLEFPEVFGPDGRGGFDVVLGNPPWDLVKADGKFDKILEKQKNWFKIGSYKILHGRRDLYKLFLVRHSGIITNIGRLAFLLPIGLFFEDDSSELRKQLYSAGSVVSLQHFQNHRKSFFPSVHASYRFTAITYCHQKDLPHRFSTVIKLPSLLDKPSSIDIPSHEVKSFLGEDFSAVLFPNIEYYQLHRKIMGSLRTKPQLQFNVVAEFHATSDQIKGLFEEAETPTNWRTLKNRSIHQFNYQYDKPEKYILEKNVKERLVQKGLPVDIWINSRRLLFRDIARNDDTRTLICCLAPIGFVSTYDTPMVVPEMDDYSFLPEALPFLCGLFNSFIYDFLIRPFVDKHIKGYTLKRLPIPAYERNNILHQKIKKLTLQLTDLISADRSTIVDTNPSIIETRAELEATIAQALGLTANEFTFVLSTFSDNVVDIHFGIQSKNSAINKFRLYAHNEERDDENNLPSLFALKDLDNLPTENKTSSFPEIELGADSAVSEGISAAATRATHTPASASPAEKVTALPSTDETPAADALPSPDAHKYDLYRCQACGKRVFKFDQADHTRKVHGGVEPGYSRIA